MVNVRATLKRTGLDFTPCHRSSRNGPAVNSRSFQPAHGRGPGWRLGVSGAKKVFFRFSNPNRQRHEGAKVRVRITAGTQRFAGKRSQTCKRLFGKEMSREIGSKSKSETKPNKAKNEPKPRRSTKGTTCRPYRPSFARRATMTLEVLATAIEVMSDFGPCATDAREPRQVRKEATVASLSVCCRSPEVWLHKPSGTPGPRA